jgi:hypothetical protein
MSLGRKKQSKIRKFAGASCPIGSGCLHLIQHPATCLALQDQPSGHCSITVKKRSSRSLFRIIGQLITSF